MTFRITGVRPEAARRVRRYNRRSTDAGHFAMQLTAVLMPAEEGGFVALNPETGTTTQGESLEEALANLREATALHLEEFPGVPSGSAFVTTFELPPRAA